MYIQDEAVHPCAMNNDRTGFIEDQNQLQPLCTAHNEFGNIIFYFVKAPNGILESGVG